MKTDRRIDTSTERKNYINVKTYTQTSPDLTTTHFISENPHVLVHTYTHMHKHTNTHVRTHLSIYIFITRSDQYAFQCHKYIHTHTHAHRYTRSDWYALQPS